MHDLAHRYIASLEDFINALDSRKWQLQDYFSAGGLAWRVFQCKTKSLPSQGWKIHLSVAAVEALKLFEIVLPVLIEHQVTFKIPKTIEAIVLINSGQFGETQIGKIVTIYPSTVQEAMTLAQHLDKILPTTQGPVIPSDLPLRDGGAVYFRYGAFWGGDVITEPSGKIVPALRKPDGLLVEDQRSITGMQPAWAPKLPVSCASPKQPDYAREIVINGRKYLPLTLLYTSPKSKVILGLDVERCETIVIKAARPGVGGDLFGFDECDRLINEHSILTYLEDCDGLCPRSFGISDGDPMMLVIEDIKGVSLDRMNVISEQIQSLPLLATAIARLHERGIVHRDIKLSNAITNKGSLRLIDFGLAASVGSNRVPSGGTRNFIPPEDRPDNSATTARDVYALGACVAHAVLGCNPALLPEKGGRLIGLLHAAGAHLSAHIVKKLMHPNPSHRPSAAGAAKVLEENQEKLVLEAEAIFDQQPSLGNQHWSKRASWEAALSTRRYLQPAHHGHWWKNFHYLANFPSEAINIGASGIIIGLASIDHALGRRDFDNDISGGADWLISRSPIPNSHGLFTGNAGVALALALAGKRLARRDLIEHSQIRLLAAASPSAELDLFCGAAGVLWAGCLIADILNEDWPLEIVRTKAELLLDSVENVDGVVVWPVSKTSRTLDNAPYTGAAHGPTGIAMALGIWGRRSGCNRAVQLAKETFRGLHAKALTSDGKAIRISFGTNSEAAPAGIWCHGIAGYLWCMLQAFGDDPTLHAQMDWAVNSLSLTNFMINPNPTYCHGLSMQLELWRMLSTIPRYRNLAIKRAAQIVLILQLLQQRLEGKIVWSSDEPEIITPDLWIGFLGPAVALALWASGRQDALLSSSWLSSCANPK
jgi:serine/threonine protein kinase